MPTNLKDGDEILFGSDSLMIVHITPASNEETTVEQHLRSDCALLVQRVKVRMPLKDQIVQGPMQVQYHALTAC